ncbi:MAG TPA: ThuA domain-containing protein [Isosphaeraceae bacterium]|nr:ThuA domain-containing protein [Isosphaeraceae bacterium]
MRCPVPVAVATTLLLILGLAPPRQEGRPKVLILTGENNHHWKETTPFLKKALEDRGRLDVDVSDDSEAPILADAGKLKPYKVLVLNLNRRKRWARDREANFLAFVRDGGGVVVVHAADNAFDGWDEYDKLVGGTWRAKGTAFPNRGTFHPEYGRFEVKVVDRDHPITRGLGASFTTKDEKYTNLKLQENIHVLAEASHDGKPQPLLFWSEYGKGRMFQTALGHDLAAMRTPEFLTTFVRGTRWAAGLDAGP